MHRQSLAIHAGRTVDPTTGAVAQPLYLSSTFERDADGGYARGFDYIRDAHPNRAALQCALAALETGAGAVAFASGSAASMSVIQSFGGAHIVASHDAYHGTLGQFAEAPRFGTETSLADTTQPEAVANAMREDTALVWIETPSNPLLRISDIAAVAKLAHARGALVAVDNTFATPMLQQPLALGADFSVHSTTKYIGGHSDVCGGVVVAREAEHLGSLSQFLKRAGAVPSAFDCWLLQRSLATLALRMREHGANAAALARFLDNLDGVERVIYPGLKSHPDHELAQRQMQGFGGMLSFCVHGGRTEALAVAARLKMITRATSLGGVESLIEHRASIEGPTTRAPENLLRVSVGLEHVDDLSADLAQAIEG